MDISHGKNTYHIHLPLWLIPLPIIGLAIIILATQYVNNTHTNPVIDAYYATQGINSKNLIQSIDQAKSIDLQANINIDLSVWEVILSANTPVNTNHLVISLHSINAGNSPIHITLFNAGNQTYRGTLSDIEEGLWHIDITPKQSNKKWRLKGKIDSSSKHVLLKN